jgi:hypothetical protein
METFTIVVFERKSEFLANGMVDIRNIDYSGNKFTSDEFLLESSRNTNRRQLRQLE